MKQKMFKKTAVVCLHQIASIVDLSSQNLLRIRLLYLSQQNPHQFYNILTAINKQKYTSLNVFD